MLNLTNHEMTNEQSPAWSPDGRQIAFSSNRDGNFDIYVMDSDGKNVRNLTKHGRRDHQIPTWSPDGRQIAFSSNRDGGDDDIYVMDSDGKNVHRLTKHKKEDILPAWSPGGRIAFSSNRDGNVEIYVMEVDVMDGDGDGGTPSFEGEPVADRTVVAGEAMTPLVLPMALGGDGELSYSLSPAVPGLTFDAATRTLSGTPTEAEDYALTYRVADSDGDADELTFTVTVEGKPIVNREPTFSGTVADQTVTEGEVMTPLVLPAGSGGDGELSYSLSPAVPGLTFDAATRTLSGTPTEAEDYALTYRVADSDGDADELTFTVTVEGKPIVNREPTFSGTVADQTVTEGEVMTPLVLPAGSGGDGELSYSLSPAVPGLTFDAATRTLSGTPTEAEDYALTYRVADSDGDADELTFALKVDGLPSFEGTAELPGGASMEFVWIEPGVFQMGSKDRTGRKDEWPIHEVEISRGFWLGKYEITQSQWKSVMDTEPWSGRDRVEANSSHPAVIISWNEVQEFIGRLNAAAGEELYRLPTEAEWEYACRAGSTTRWSFGDDESQLRNYAWYFDNTEGAKAVGSKLPNPWGLYDMHGNVWEWVQDRYDEEYYSRSVREDPQGPESGLGRVIRGGHFGHIDGVRSAYRQFYPSGSRSYTIGVRLLRIAGD